MKILLDNGHGENTPGKRSPDGKLREYLYAREITEAIERELKLRGYDAERIVHENVDVPLAERARRVNELCGRLGTSNVILISIHCKLLAMEVSGCKLVVGLHILQREKPRQISLLSVCIMLLRAI